MDAPNILFSIFFLLLVGGVTYALFKRGEPSNEPSVEPNIFAYGGLLIQAHETAKIVVQGIQEAWRTGEIADDEREDDAVEKMVELYPQLKEDDLRRMVKSAVYLLRWGAGKQIDKIMEQVPEVPDRPLGFTDTGGATGVFPTRTQSPYGFQEAT